MIAEFQQQSGTAGAAVAAPALLVQDIGKSYPGVCALRDVSLHIEQGEIRGLVGENGSGKSTLIKLLSGSTSPDNGGCIEFFGKSLPYGDPIAARNLGIATVHQEPLVFPLLSTLENVFVEDMSPTRPFVSRRRALQEFDELCGQLGVNLDPSVLAGELSVADQTMIELLRATRRKVRLLLLDEPTASLGPIERERLYQLIHRLHREWEVTLLFISHDLDEVIQLSTSITVFRDGEHIHSGPTSEWTKRSMVKAMLGDTASERLGLAMLDDSRSPSDSKAVAETKPEQSSLLEVKGLTVPGLLTDVSLDVKSGEIVGIAGLVGAGRTELLKALAGDLKVAGGELRIEGRKVGWPGTIRHALRLGIALVPEDRATEGLVPGMRVQDNVVMTDLRGVARFGFLRQRHGKARSSQILARLVFRGQLGGPARALSGGNQQKVMIGKWLHKPPKVLLLDEPTRGVDVGAKSEILETLRGLTSGGQAIILVSSEFEELLSVSDRIILFSGGRVIGELPESSFSVHEILHRLFGVEREAFVTKGG